MSKEIIINVTGEHSRIAIVEDGELVELYIENPDNVRTIGDIHLGRVRRILPGIKAAFVDIGQKQDAFLHFSDLSDNLPDLLELSDGKVGDQLKKHLAKAPKAPEDGELDLELETPQEQRAARRRRDIKRTHGRGRRGRGQQNDTKEQGEAQSPEAAAEAPSQTPKHETKDSKRDASRRSSSGKRQSEREPSEAKSHAKPEASAADTDETDSREERAAMSRSRRSQPPATDDVPGQSPSIIPPDAVADPPSAEAPAQEAEQQEREQQNQEQERPKRRRGSRGGRNRGGRNRNRSRDADQPDSENAPASADANDSDNPDAAPAEPTREGRSKSSRSGRGRGRGRSSTDDSSSREARTSDDPHKRDDERGESDARAKKSKRSSGRSTDANDSDKADRKPEKAEATSEPAAAKPSVPSSRFVIDLTSKPGRADRRAREEEEEEEEEEKRSSSRRRRGGRRRGGRSRGGSKASGSNSNGSDGSADGKDDSEKKSGRGRSRSSSRSGGRSSGRSSSGRSGGRGDRQGGGRGNGSGGARPETYLKQDQKLIVKITKEPISAKGPRVSTDVSLAGRFLVLIPQADYVAVSKKIESSKERRRLRALARSLLPENFGLIVRTVAENRDAKALDTDLRLLLQKWHKIEDQLRKKPDPPKALHEDVNMVSSIIRDLFSEDYDRIVVDDPKVHRNVKNYVQAVAPQMAPLVKLHDGKEHVFRKYKIDGEVRAAFESRVNLPGGGYLFIEHTEAMHVVDVNSGRAGRGLSQEQNSLRVNVESAKMIAKQLRLRDLGGIICVDFIDMRSESARKKVYDELKKEFRKDRAVTKLLPMSDFGVVQITRQRLRPSITTTTNVDDLPPAPTEHDAPTAHIEVEDEPRTEARTGPQPTTAEIIEELERWLETYRDEVQDQHRKRPILIKLHPLLAAYLNRGLPSTLTRWRFRTRLKLKLDVAEDADPLSFAVRDEKSGKNLTKKYDPDRREDE